MHCILSGHDYVYDIQTITQVFFPNESFTRVHEPLKLGLTAVSGLSADGCFGALYADSRILEKHVMCLPKNDGGLAGAVSPVPVAGGAPYKQEIRRRLMVALFLALKAYTGKNPPWGALTGIRPSKMARLLLEKGYSRGEVICEMGRNYFARADKIALALDVAESEKNILSKQPGNAFALYVGIPFCPSRCLYCSFASYPLGGNTERVGLYLGALEKELSAIRELTRGQALSSIYVGGGTPTALNEWQLDKLLSAIANLFDPPTEFSVEAGRPDTVNAPKLRILKNYGVNRISLNPQTMNDATLERIGRGHTVRDFCGAFGLARSEGFDNINADIILGLPGETPDHAAGTMKGLLAFAPENVTVHTLAIKRASPLHEALGKYLPPELSDLEKMLEISQLECRNAGMSPYYMYRQKNMLGNFENVGYSLPGRQSLYNVFIMEETQSIWAAGAGAVTKLIFGGRLERVFNVKSLNDYISRVDEMIKRKEVWRDAVSNPEGD